MSRKWLVPIAVAAGLLILCLWLLSTKVIVDRIPPPNATATPPASPKPGFSPSDLYINYTFAVALEPPGPFDAAYGWAAVARSGGSEYLVAYALAVRNVTRAYEQIFGRVYGGGVARLALYIALAEYGGRPSLAVYVPYAGGWIYPLPANATPLEAAWSAVKDAVSYTYTVRRVGGCAALGYAGDGVEVEAQARVRIGVAQTGGGAGTEVEGYALLLARACLVNGVPLRINGTISLDGAGRIRFAAEAREAGAYRETEAARSVFNKALEEGYRAREGLSADAFLANKTLVVQIRNGLGEPVRLISVEVGRHYRAACEVPPGATSECRVELDEEPPGGAIVVGVLHFDRMDAVFTARPARQD